MARRVFRGDAVAVAQVTKVTPANVEIGDEFVLTINGKDVSYVAEEATAADVVNGLVAAWNASTIPEFAEITASAGTDDGGYTVTHMLLTADTEGRPFEVTEGTANSTLELVTVAVDTAGVEAVNEVQTISIGEGITGGTFTLSFDGETTAALAYDADAATIQAALEALSTIGSGNVTVTGSGPWSATFGGTLAASDVQLMTGDGSGLTGSGVTIETTRQGAGLSNEIVRVILNGATSGTFTLSYGSGGATQTTSALAYDATAADVKAALEALSGIGSGNVEVYGEPTICFLIVFVGDLAGTNVEVVTMDADLLEGLTVPEMYYVQGGGQATANEYQLVLLNGADDGVYTLTIDGLTTDPLVAGADDNMILTALTNAGISGVAVTSLVEWRGGYGFYLEYEGDYANTNVEQVAVDTTSLIGGTGLTVETVSDGGAHINEQQTITVDAVSGTYTLSFDGETTSALAYNANATTIQAALEALSTIGSGNVSVSGSGPYVVTFAAEADMPEITAGGLSGTIVVTEATGGVAPADEVQTVTIDSGAAGGTFTLSFLGVTTTGIAYDAAAATVEAALEALATVGSGNVSVSGSTGGPWEITFTNELGDQDVDLLEVDGDNLTGAAGNQTLSIAEVTRSKGPNHWDDPDNWVGGDVPESGDDVDLETGAIALLYGLRQRVDCIASAANDTLTMSELGDFVEGQKVQVSNDGGSLPGGLSAATDYYVLNLDRDAKTLQLATSEGGTAVDITSAGTGTHTIGVRLNSLTSHGRYTGNVGNPQVNPSAYYEYRALYLQIGLLASGARRVLIGRGQGSGSSRMRIDTGRDQTDWEVILTGGSVESGVPALLLKGTHEDNTLVLIDGDAGLGFLAGEVSTVDTIVQRGGSLALGEVSVGSIDKTGGELLADDAVVNGAYVVRG